MTKPQHTPLPYAVYQLADDRKTYGENAAKFIIVTQDDEHEVCGVVDCEETGAFIVKACNAHYELLEKLKAARHWINDECDRRGKEDREYEAPAATILASLDAVLAKAEGNV